MHLEAANDLRPKFLRCPGGPSFGDLDYNDGPGDAPGPDDDEVPAERAGAREPRCHPARLRHTRCSRGETLRIRQVLAVIWTFLSLALVLNKGSGGSITKVRQMFGTKVLDGSIRWFSGGRSGRPFQNHRYEPSRTIVANRL